MLQSPKVDRAASFLAKNIVGWNRNNRIAAECQDNTAVSGIGPERGKGMTSSRISA